MYEARKPKETKKPENVVEISEIGIEDFMKVQLRVGEIVEAEKVKKANKLLKFSVKIGDETRTIVSGIAKYYTPEEMVGKQVVVVSNLKPAKLCGIESQGMLLCACTDDELTLVTPEKRMPTGATVR
jgi:methionyl-tRNA synthetase